MVSISTTNEMHKFQTVSSRICTRSDIFFLQDPREALIISLKREVTSLQSENEHLRNALHLQTPEVLSGT